MKIFFAYFLFQKKVGPNGAAPHVREPSLPGVVESYVNLGRFYDHAALVPLRGAIEAATAAYKAPYNRAYHCFTAAAELAEDNRSLLRTPTLEAKARKRARGILSREVKRAGRAPGHIQRRFLSGLTCQGAVCRFDTVDALCRKVYELVDSYGLGAGMLEELCAGAVAAGYDVILCPSPLFPDRPEHLLIPALSLAFVTSTPTLSYPGRPYRRIRLDAKVDGELMKKYKARLKFSRKVAAALLDEGAAALAQAKAAHDELETLYNPHVDFDGVYRQADEVIEELMELKG